MSRSRRVLVETLVLACGVSSALPAQHAAADLLDEAAAMPSPSDARMIGSSRTWPVRCLLVMLLALPACRVWLHETVDEASGCPVVDSLGPRPEVDWSAVDESRWDPTGIPLWARFGASGAWRLGREAREILASGADLGDVSARLSDSRTLVTALDRHSLLVIFCPPTEVVEDVRVWVVKI